MFLRSILITGLYTLTAIFGSDAWAQDRGRSQAKAPIAIRGLEGIDTDGFSRSLKLGLPTVSRWFRRSLQSFSSQTQFTYQVRNELENLAGILEKERGLVNLTQVSKRLADLTLDRQQKIRNLIPVNLNREDHEMARKAVVLLQFTAEEALVLASRYETSRPAIYNFLPLGRLRPGSTLSRGVPVLPGDLAVQIGGSFMSSHFIAHSQVLPGLASHVLLIRGAVKDRIQILEALIEDGVNVRFQSPNIPGRFMILALKDTAKRSLVAQSLEKFISEKRVPILGDGHNPQGSPILYDASMDVDNIKKGTYFCTALAKDIYERAGLSWDLVPYRSDRQHWNLLEGLEKEIYSALGIKLNQIAAPGDVLFNPAFEIKGQTINPHALRESRRLRAAMDGLFTVLHREPAFATELLKEFMSLPSGHLDKRLVIGYLEAIVGKTSQIDLDPEKKKKMLQAIEQLRESLPQNAELRQVVFFVYMNSVLQPELLETLAKYESSFPAGFAPPSKLTEKSMEVIRLRLQEALEFLKLI